MAARLGGVALLALLATAQAGQDETRAWIQRMNHAVVNRNYDGAFTQLFGSQTQVFRIVHRMQDGVMVERVISTDGSGYEQKRQGSRWAEFRPKNKLVVVAERNRSFGHFPALNGIDRQTSNHYDIRSVGNARLLGRDVQVLQIDPKDNLRYGYRFWLDRESALPLKFQRTTLDGKVLKEIAFISPPSLPDRISDEQRAEIVGAYLGGATAVALADQFGISDYSVRGILIDAGVKRPSKRLSGETLAEIGSLRASGVALAEIGRRVGVSESTVSLVREASRQPASLRRDKGPADLRK